MPGITEGFQPTQGHAEIRGLWSFCSLVANLWKPPVILVLPLRAFFLNLGDMGPLSAEVKLAVNPYSAADVKLGLHWLHGWLMESGDLVLVEGLEIHLGLAAAPAFSHSWCFELH